MIKNDTWNEKNEDDKINVKKDECNDNQNEKKMKNILKISNV